ncbi:adenylyl/guanylyl cyclase [Crocosphaera subtropica ATCC 51142]|uniref:Adenylyl/guanylyl cyclase n=1 Tax=Crocosphaera subtropica (strain ATCC 51142 / BH68) TaxID=43989 RepID=B1WWE8_CROS5|nr:adenylate/guanylate cyclase domain-containing protein [Crocosphaera subtropica]ACB54076.1 adenylyl/guanylyl cyclase [Crocosphaera subtropica ATCC 51142]
MEPLDSSSLGIALQKIIDQLGQLLKVDCCILRPFHAHCLIKNSIFYYPNKNQEELSLLEKTIIPIEYIEVITSTDNFLTLAQPKTLEETQRKNAYKLTKIGASLLIPLTLEQKFIAVLGLHRYCSFYHWQDQEIAITKMVVEQITLAISQAQAYQKLRALAQREALINRITNAIRCSLEPQLIFTAITQELGNGLKVDGCALSLWTKADKFVQCVGLYDHYQGSINPLPQSVVPIASNPVLQQLINTKKPVVLEDMDRHPEMTQFDLPLRESAQALLIVPLLVDSEIIGSISLRQTDHSRRWLSTEIELAKTVASQAAIAVQQARLYEKTKQQAEQLQKSEQEVKQLNQYLTESVLKRFLPASMVNKVAKGELSLDLTPEPRLVTILFTDLVGYTPLASHLGTQGVATLLNEYLEAMTAVVFHYGGTVDKFIGDAVVALFGAPEDLTPKKQVYQAIAVAREMHNQLDRLNERWQSQELIQQPVRFRCGIHQGMAVVGMFGGGQRSDYTAIGSAVNIAARLQEVADSGMILVSATVAQFLTASEVTALRPLELKGVEEDIKMFCVKISAV